MLTERLAELVEYYIRQNIITNNICKSNQVQRFLISEIEFITDTICRLQIIHPVSTSKWPS